MLLVGVWVNRNWILGNWIREVQARGKEWSSLYWLPSVLANKHWLEKFLKPPLPKVDAYFFSYLSIFERYLEKNSHYENRSIILYTHNDPELGSSEHQVEILNRAFSVHFYCSRDAEKLVALGLKQEKVRVALCAVDVDCVRDQNISREPKTVVLASKYGSRKGLETFPELVAASFILELPQAIEVLDPLRERLDVAVHHGGGALATQQVPLPVHFEPVFGEHLAAGHRLSHAIDENLAPAAGQ